MRIVVVVPTYNEAENLAKLVSALFSLPLDLGILVVDDNSPDGTGRIADGISAKNKRLNVIHRSTDRGYGLACLRGFQKALDDGADVIAQMDADFSHDPVKLIDMVCALEDNDVVLGSRYVVGGGVDRNWGLWRKGLSAWSNFYARTILNIPLRDVTTGYRLWRRDTLLGMPLNRVRSNGYVFLIEMAYIASCLEYRIGEVPIYFLDRSLGKSKMNLKVQIEAALRVWQVRWRYRDLLGKGKIGRTHEAL